MEANKKGSTSLSSNIKNYKILQLHVELNFEEDNGVNKIERDTDDEVADSLIEAFAPENKQKFVQETQEEEQESYVDTHMKEVMYKEGQPPLKRGRSRHGKHGRRIR
ncbi:hypothetical protein HAX54_019284 [Datura stramonium]|uniref:Uncharacterized protein n=1 Tax=Datura stramonium TaxID=4076 RepID=A0ABS8UQW0_DATST|nr:hypothetical protein [Datura stramonium]